MKNIFIEENPIPCVFQSGPIKSQERCKMKAQVEYRNCEFPKSAHLLDIIRCQITFASFEHLKLGLDHFVRCINNKNNCLQVMRIKNGFFHFSSPSSKKQDLELRT